MRIEETNQILKETRHTREPVKRGNIISRAWRSLLGLLGIR
ncbi:MAG TPA: hypothetical protein VM779_02980 [Thermoanaerobaculia bacterium]|nr:hypothetical protein [Thermoanaerobaculia bacterium]